MDEIRDFDSENYVNFNIRRPQKASSVGNLNDSSIYETSLPLSDTDILCDLDDSLKIKVDDLEQKLASANDMVDNLLLENGQLKQQIEKDKKIIETYKKFDFSEVQTSPILANKKKRFRILTGAESTPNSRKSVTTDRQKLLIDSQQESINELNEKIRQLEEWIKEEKKKNEEIEKERREAKVAGKSRRKVVIKQYKCPTSALKKVKYFAKKIKKLEKQCLILNTENIKLEHRVLELTTTQNLVKDRNNSSREGENKIERQEQKRIKEDEKVADSIRRSQTKRRNITIFSDILGQGIVTKLLRQTSEDYNIINYCKPGASYDKILENFTSITKSFDSSDTVVILINKYNESIDMKFGNNEYIKIIKEILYEEKRKFNVILCGIRYDNQNDMSIYNTNMDLVQLASCTSKVKYIDPNFRDNRGKLYNYSYLKGFFAQAIATAVDSKIFPCTSTLRFIPQSSNQLLQQSSTNFQTKNLSKTNS